jgi:hypothetical protein
MTILKWLLYSNTWVAGCFGILLYGFLVLNQVENAPIYALWGFSGTIAAYQLHRLLRLRQIAPTDNPRLLWMLQFRHFQWIWFLIHWTNFSILSLFFSWNGQAFIVLLTLSIIIGLYALPFGNISGLRSLPYLKNLLIAGSWSSLLIIPLLQHSIPIPVVELALIFGAVYIQIIPFDLRDIEHDHHAMRTIPQLVGRRDSLLFYSALIAAISLFLLLLNYSILLVLTYLFVGIIGVIKPPKKTQLEFYEVLWELPLLVLGLIFWMGQVI